MFKKIFSFMCCFAPVGAMSATIDTVTVIPNDDKFTSPVLVGIDQVAAIENGNSMVITGVSPYTTALNVAGNLQVFDNPDVAAPAGTLFVSNAISDGTGPFTIQTDGNIDVGGGLLINSNRKFVVSSYSADTTFDIGVGFVKNLGTLNILNVRNFVSDGTVVTNGALSINADTINVGSVAIDGGTATLVANKMAEDETDVTLQMVQLINNSASNAAVTLTADVIESGTIQNNATAGDVAINVSGQLLHSTGNIENSGAGMIIDATGAVVVDGTMKNSVGKMIIDAASLTVSGGSGSEPSFFNNGDLVLNISGDVTLAHGFDLNMLANQYGNSFRLLAGGLNLGVTDSNFFANELNSYSVTINNDYVAGSVSNGLANENATMYLAANDLTVGGVKNNAVFDSGASTGTMMLVAKTGVLTTGAIEDKEGAETTLQANSKIQISGGVSVSGDLFASAPVINVGASDSAENIINGGTLSLRASNSSIGQILVYGDISNSGDVDIVGREMAVFGTLTNQSGSIDIDGSVYNDSFVTIGGINVSGGIINIDTTDGVEIAQTANLGTGTFVVSDGVVNLKENVHSLNLTASSGGLSTSVNVAGNMIATATAQSSGAGDVNVLASGVDNFTLTSNGDISVGGNVLSVESDLKARDINLVSQGRNIKIGGNVSAETSGNDLSFDAEQITIDGNVSAGDYASVSLLSNNITVGGLTDFVTQGTGNVINGLVYVAGKQIDGQKSSLTLTADKSGIVINNGLAVGSESAVTGLAIDNSNVNNVTLASTASGADITIASGISNAADGQLILGSKRDVVVSGAVKTPGVLDVSAGQNVEFNNDVTVGGALVVNATNNVTIAGVQNDGFASFSAGGTLTAGAIISSEASASLPGEYDYGMMFNVVGDMSITSLELNGGVVDIDVQNLYVNNNVSSGSTGTVIDVNGGSLNILADGVINVNGVVDVTGNLYQGINKLGTLNILSDDITLSSNGLKVSGGFTADTNAVNYLIENSIDITGGVSIASGALADFAANEFASGAITNAGILNLNVDDNIWTGDINNSGIMTVSAPYTINMGAVINSGNLSIDSGLGIWSIDNLLMSGGNVIVSGAGLKTVSEFTSNGVLYQNNDGVLLGNDMNIKSDAYIIDAANVTVAGIKQYSGVLDVLSSDVTINGDISATDLTITADVLDGKLDMLVNGSILGNTKILGLEQMTIGQDYVFDANSQLLAEILQYDSSAIPGNDDNVTTRNYWSKVSLNDDNTLGQITNAADGSALVQVNGVFKGGITYDPSFNLNSDEVALANSQIGIKLVDTVDAGDAIWLLNATGGVQEFSSLEKIRNISVLFCNADGTICRALKDGAGAYISLRDTNADSVSDSLYVVFDPRFGGPVLIENNKIQPIVLRQPQHTDGEYVAAGALDNLIVGALEDNGFFNRTPIELIPALFQGTNMENMMLELYNRLEYYAENADGASFVPFARMVQPREIEQVIGSIVLNNHTAFRNFEDRMFDEFIWNRNNSLKKAWADIDFGLFTQDYADGGRVDGNRFSLAGGFDWQHSKTLILGLTGRISHTSSDNDLSLDLSYLPGQSVLGGVGTNVSDTNIGLGAYLMKAFAPWARLYGNAYLDMHLIDVERDQNFVSSIDGFGTSFALMSEWGMMHDWLNQYIVGNLYVRTGYNFGFSMTEKSAGQDYMKLESDGYFMLTPGYSLTAQKRIYPTSWFQVRPYATIGVEYDVFGVPDFAKYKFAVSNTFSEYGINIDPLWANIGGGFEFISVSGAQVGIDYRYQYNNDIQLHNIKLSGSYRF